MSYLKEFLNYIINNDFSGLKRLWEEYCTCDVIDGEELKKILEAIKGSPLAELFGKEIESVLPLWSAMDEKELSYDVACLIFDLETANTPELASLAYKILKERYGTHEYFNEKIRLIGLRQKTDFQGALSNYELLSHMEKGQFVYHAGGWGAGEIVEISLMREQLVIEFENVVGRKDVTFKTAFKSLIPLSKEHFLARRFGFPDELEKEARENPVEVIYLLLKDMGPQTAADIKEELCELVIPKQDWAKWWQSARSKIKKNTMIETPQNIHDAFALRACEVSHDERFKAKVEESSSPEALIEICYNFTRDFPEIVKNESTARVLRTSLESLVSSHETGSVAARLQAELMLKDFFPEEARDKALVDLVVSLESIRDALQGIEIVALKKKVLMIVRDARSDWKNCFIELLFDLKQGTLKDYVLKELASDKDAESLLDEKMEALLDHPTEHPRTFVWYFSRVIAGKEDLSSRGNISKQKLLEGFLIVLDYVEQHDAYRDMVKKMYGVLTGNRFLVVRTIIAGADTDYLREFLLLVTKCQSFDSHDIKIMQALAEVANPEMKRYITDKTADESVNEDVIWTTQQGYKLLEERISRIGTVETVENAREIEAARALGDLRENAEYKAALEKRSRLQSDLQTLTRQLGKARVITAADISPDKVDIGSSVDLKNSLGVMSTYTILGPWDADPENNILSYQTKFATAMIGNMIGDTFRFQDETYTVVGIRNAITGDKR